MDGIEVLVLLDVGGLEDKEKFEKHVKKEGFKPVEGEDFVYTATSTTTTFSTKAYILEVFKTGSFSKAAQNLFITQPALSIAIKKIEKDILVSRSHQV